MGSGLGVTEASSVMFVVTKSHARTSSLRGETPSTVAAVRRAAAEKVMRSVQRSMASSLCSMR